MLIEPIMKRNELWFVSFISEPIRAAWPEPMPGRKEQRGATNIAVNEVLINSFLARRDSRSFVIFCGLIVVFCFMLIIKEDAPNKPVNNGRSGSLTGRLKVKMPRIPDNMNIIIEGSMRSSLKIK